MARVGAVLGWMDGRPAASKATAAGGGDLGRDR